MKSKHILISVALMLLLGAFSTTNAQSVLNANVTASANVLTELIIMKVHDVSFGNIAQNSTPIIDVVNQTASAVGTNYQEGQFDIQGQAGSLVTVQFPTGATLIGQPGHTGNALNYTLQVAKTGNEGTRLLLLTGQTVTVISGGSNDGKAFLYVGGTLTNVTNQSGSFISNPITFSVVYN
jgi:hypothetical protein